MANKNIGLERGARLKNLRKKTGLTRLAFSEQTGISPHTLKALEHGERELSAQKALLFSNLFSNLFSVCLGEDVHEASFDYLYYGKKNEAPEATKLTSDRGADGRLQKDIHFFTTHSAYMGLKITDDLMSPFYKAGDFVGGKKISNKNRFFLYQGQICIIEALNGDKFLRRVIKSDNQKITSCILNTSMGQAAPIVEEVEARSLAQAIWHWHVSELVGAPGN